MAEKTDAFGNPIGPQQTKGVPGGPTVGGTAHPSESGLPNTQNATTGVPQQYDTHLASSGPQASNESFGQGRSVSFGTITLAVFLVIVIVGGGLLVFAGIFKGAKNAIDDAKTANDNTSSTGSAGATGIGKDSLFAAGNFGEAKRLLKGTGQGDPYILRIAPDRIDAQLVNGSKLANVQVKAGSDSAEIFSTSQGGASLTTFKFAAISNATPARAVRRGANKLNESTDDINYIVVNKILGDVQIDGFFKDGKHFSANSRGGDVKAFD